MQQTPNQKELFGSLSPLEQWADQSGKQDPKRNNQEEAQRGKRKLDGRTSTGPMGLQCNSKNDHERITLLIHLWLRGHGARRDWSGIIKKR